MGVEPRMPQLTSNEIVARRDGVFKPTKAELAAAVHHTVPDLVADNLAVLFCGINPGLYTAAIGRFQRVVDDFQTTNPAPEALHRLTEIYLLLGLPDQARKTAAVLGHNYPGSEWYESSYSQLVATGQVQDTATSAPAGRPGFFSRNLPSIF